MVYLFIGQDSPHKDSPSSCKDIQLKQIKEKFLPKDVEQFNLDTLYAEGLKLKNLQEKMLSLPVRSAKRIIVIRNAQDLSQDIDDFILRWAEKESKDTVLLLDMDEASKKEAFLGKLYKKAKVFRFKEVLSLNTFNLSRRIEQRNAAYALTALEQLLRDGERPERILGGLRFVLENSRMSGQDIKRRIKLLLDCDLEIKTSRAKPSFALEKLVVKLCSLAQPLH